jgi:hypothetical protein
MPAKPYSELTHHETTMLAIGARLLAALREYIVRPPTQGQLVYWNTKVGQELVCKTCFIHHILVTYVAYRLL